MGCTIYFKYFKRKKGRHEKSFYWTQQRLKYTKSYYQASFLMIIKNDEKSGGQHKREDDITWHISDSVQQAVKCLSL